MAQDPKTYRDPKVTQPTRSSSGGAMRWVWIGLAIIVVLVLLAWLFGWNTTDEVTTRPVDDTEIVEPTGDAAVIEEGDIVNETETALEGAGESIESGAEATGDAVGDAAEATGDALEGAAETTGTALEGAAEETGTALEGAAEETGDAVEGAAEATGEAAEEVETEIVPVEPID